MLYHLDENSEAPSWANSMLKYLRYNSHPEIMQSLIEQIFETATKKIKIPGCKVIPVPMFKILDGKTTEDYDNRVEPSVQGGKKLGEYFWDIIKKHF